MTRLSTFIIVLSNDSVNRRAQLCISVPACAILRDFKNAVTSRIDAWNGEIAFCKDHQQISLYDVRVLLVIG